MEVKKNWGKVIFYWWKSYKSCCCSRSMILALSLACGIILGKFYFTSLTLFFSPYAKRVSVLFTYVIELLWRLQEMVWEDARNIVSDQWTSIGIVLSLFYLKTFSNCFKIFQMIISLLLPFLLSFFLLFYYYISI